MENTITMESVEYAGVIRDINQSVESMEKLMTTFVSWIAQVRNYKNKANVLQETIKNVIVILINIKYVALMEKHTKIYASW